MQAVVVDVRAVGAVDAGKVDATAAKVPQRDAGEPMVVRHVELRQGRHALGLLFAPDDTATDEQLHTLRLYSRAAVDMQHAQGLTIDDDSRHRLFAELIQTREAQVLYMSTFGD